MLHYFLIAFSAMITAFFMCTAKDMVAGFFNYAATMGGKMYWTIAIVLSIGYLAMTAAAFAWFATTVTG